MSKQKKHKNKNRNVYVPLILLLFFLSLALIFLHLFAPHGLLVENESTEQKSIPTDLKTQMRQASPSASYRVPVLLYHYVEYVKDKGDKIRQSLDVTPDVFTKQVQTLLTAGYTFLTAADLANILDNKMELPKNPILLTFDDGYRDFYTDVFPVLKKYQVKATIYVVPGFLDTSNYLLTTQLQDVAQSGLVEIAAHTMHHVYLKNASARTAQEEITKSKSVLEEKLGIPIVSFAYPYGAFDKQAVDIVKNTGFKTAASTLPGMDVSEQTRYFFPRIRPGYRTGLNLIRYLEEAKFTPLAKAN